MAQSLGYKIGHALGRMPLWLKIVFALLVAGVLFRPSTPDTPSSDHTSPIPSQATAQLPSSGPSEKDQESAQCNSSLDRRRIEYASAMKEKKYWDAALTLRNCANALQLTEFQGLVRDAEIKSHMATISDANASVAERIRAMEMIARDYPDVGAKYEAQAKRLAADADRIAKATEVKRKKSEGVAIGMSKEDVLSSSWGKPNSINATTTAAGKREQWVYGLRSYLYFENGVLTAIQN